MSINTSDFFSRLPPELILSIGLLSDIKTVLILSCVSRLYNSALNHPEFWAAVAHQKQITFSSDVHPKAAVTFVREEKKAAMAFAEAILGPLTWGDHMNISYMCFVKSSKILMHWPSSASIVIGSKYETYLHRYVHFVAFSTLDRFPSATNHILVVLEKAAQLAPEKQEYLIRLFNHQPCGSLETSSHVESSVKKRRERPAVELCLPSNHECINIYSRRISYL